MKNTLYFLFIIIIISCNKEFNPYKYKGTWININDDYSISSYPSITFRNDSIYLEDIYSYVLKGKFKIFKNEITYYFNNDTICNKFYFNHKDSTILVGKNKFSLWKNYSEDNNYQNYKLLGIKSLEKITQDSLMRFNNGFHMFKTHDNSLKFKFNDKVTLDKKNIISFSLNVPSHYDIPTSVIYLGKKINLKDLINCYIEMWSINKRKVLLITGYDIQTNSYYGFLDNFSFWERQFDSLSNFKIKMPKSNLNNRGLYLEKYSPILININSEKDLDLLKINKNKNILISINSNIHLNTYFKLKEIIKDYKNIQTEFNLSHPN